MGDAQTVAAVMPEFTPVEVDELYTELGTLSVQLDADPLAFGPKRLNTKVSLVRRALDRCERIFLDISHRLQVSRRLLRVSTVDFDLGKKSLFANDPETRAGRSVSDREAIAAGKLRKEVALMNDLTILEGDLAAVLDVVKAKRADLKDTEGRLRDQIRLCHEELGLGHRWGSQVPGTTQSVDDGKVDPSAAGIVDDIIGSVEGQVKADNLNGSTDLPDLDEDEVPELPIIVNPGPIPARRTPPATIVAPDEAPVVVAAPAPIAPPAPVVQVALPENSGNPEPKVTATATSVDDFLDSLPMAAAVKEPAKPKHVALDDENLMSFLADFETDPDMPSSKILSAG